jgi:hypothetical protein
VLVLVLVLVGCVHASGGRAVGPGPEQPLHPPPAAGVAVGSVRTLARMKAPRAVHTATPLRDGRVLVTGGHMGRHEQLVIHRSAELYDPAAGRFTRTGDMTMCRHKHDAVRLADGRVLLVGGSDERDNAGLYHSAELYDPTTGGFRPTGDLHDARYKLRGTSMLLRDGRVLVAGGASGPEVYQSGSALLCGGYSLTSPASDTAWLIRP